MSTLHPGRNARATAAIMVLRPTAAVYAVFGAPRHECSQKSRALGAIPLKAAQIVAYRVKGIVLGMAQHRRQDVAFLRPNPLFSRISRMSMISLSSIGRPFHSARWANSVPLDRVAQLLDALEAKHEVRDALARLSPCQTCQGCPATRSGRCSLRHHAAPAGKRPKR